MFHKAMKLAYKLYGLALAAALVLFGIFVVTIVISINKANKNYDPNTNFSYHDNIEWKSLESSDLQITLLVKGDSKTGTVVYSDQTYDVEFNTPRRPSSIPTGPRVDLYLDIEDAQAANSLNVRLHFWITSVNKVDDKIVAKLKLKSTNLDLDEEEYTEYTLIGTILE